MLGFLKRIFGGGSEQMTENVLNAGTILDVRTIGEYRDGHVKGSINIPLSDIGKKAAQLKKLKAPIGVCCRSGVRAGSATSQIKSMGVEAYNVGGWAKVNQILNNNKK